MIPQPDAFSVSDLGAHYLYLHHDKTGKILDFVTTTTNRFSVVTKELIEAGTLAAFFDFFAFENNPEQVVLTQSKPFKRSSYLVTFWTTLPRTMLRSRKSGDCYLGRIALMEFLPNFLSATAVYFLFVDREKDTLLGFPDDFHAIFKRGFAAPAEMLGRPVSDFISPSPGQWQKEALRNAALPVLDNAPVIYNKDFARESLGPEEETPFPLDVEKTAEGLRWSLNDLGPGAADSHYITLPAAINTYTHDFSLTVRFADPRGTGPVLILGDRYVREDELPDNSGYLARLEPGYHATLLKRTGFVVACAPTPVPAITGVQEITLRKSGNVLALLQDNRVTSSFFDPAFLHRTAARLSLAIRREDCFTLRGITLRIRRSQDIRPRSAAIVNTMVQPVQYFEMEPFYNQVMQDPMFRNVAAYFLHDITEMNNRIRSLDKTVKHHARESERLKSLLNRYEPEAAGLIGAGRAMERIRETARIVSPSNATVLIEGQTGTGKEVLARHIHSLSPRKEGPFVKVDCSTIPKSLMESQLFGHEKGAFTGAVSQAKGLFEQADKGTIFLDEIGNLPPETQAKLLQFLNDFTITRVGGSGPLKLDVRCIAATNVALAGLVSAGLFREDLYYRINTVLLTLPALSGRSEDIPALAAHFLEQASRELGKPLTGFSRPALKKLTDHSFQGNVRELKNAVHRAAIFCQGSTISPEDIQFVAATGTEGKKRKELPAFHLSKTDPERVKAVLREHHGRLAHAAREMGVSRVALYQYLRKRKMSVEPFREGFRP